MFELEKVSLIHILCANHSYLLFVCLRIKRSEYQVVKNEQKPANLGQFVPYRYDKCTPVAFPYRQINILSLKSIYKKNFKFSAPPV